MLLTRVGKRAIKSPDFQVLGSVSAVLVALGSVFYHLVEGLRWLDALYFTIITLTTVGYGDFSPQTDAGKVFTMFYILLGLGVLAGLIGVMADIAVEVAQEGKA